MEDGELYVRPAPVDALPVSARAVAENDLGHRAVAEKEEDHGSEELGKGLTHDLSETRPGGSSLLEGGGVAGDVVF